MGSTRPYRRLAASLRVVALALALGLVAPCAARGANLWYNGDYDLNDAASNQGKVPINFGGTYQLDTALVYDDFVVPAGQQWTLTAVYSENQMAFYQAAATATWQIRQGMSAGQGGVLIASGDTTATTTALTPAGGSSGTDLSYLDPENRISATVPNVVLSAGTYWMAVAPDSPGYYADQSYIETTSGAGAVGTPKGNNGNSFLNNTLTGAGKLTYAASNLDYSAGVVGTSVATPEPGSAMLIASFAGVALLRRRRHANTASACR